MENNFWSYTTLQAIKSKVFAESHVQKVYKIPLNNLPITETYFELESSETKAGKARLRFFSTVNQIQANNLKIRLTSPGGGDYTFTGPDITELWKGILEVNLESEINLTGTWRINMDSKDASEVDEFVYMIYQHSTNGRPTPNPWLLNYDNRQELVVDANLTLSIPLYAISTEEDKDTFYHRMLIYGPSQTNYSIVTMHDDGLLGNIDTELL